MLHANKLTVCLCSNAYDNYLQTGVQFESHDANIADSPNILANVRGSGAGFGTHFAIDFTCIQGTTVAESGWWTNNNNTIAAVADHSGHFSHSAGQGWMILPDTNAIGAGGMTISVDQLFNGVAVEYFHVTDSGKGQVLHFLSQVNFDDNAQESSNVVTGGLGVFGDAAFLSNIFGGSSDQFQVTSSGAIIDSSQLVLNQASGNALWFRPNPGNNIYTLYATFGGNNDWYFPFYDGVPGAGGLVQNEPNYNHALSLWSLNAGEGVIFQTNGIPAFTMGDRLILHQQFWH